MRVNVVDYYLKRDDIDLLVEFVDFACFTLLDKRIYRNTEIDLTFHKTSKESDPIADCGPLDGGRRPRDFEIDVYYSHLSTTRMLMLLGHECTHVEQYATGKLAYEGMNCAIWNNKRHKNLRKVYWMSPWEVQARGNELGLAVTFVDQYKKKHHLTDDPAWFEFPWNEDDPFTQKGC